MNEEQTQLRQVKAIFEEAIDYESPTDRALYLERACAGLEEVRRQVEALLAAHDGGGEFLEHSATDALMEAAAGAISEDEALSWLPEDRLIDGRYRVERVLAIGGMGVVYEAQQINPKRRVALKVMRRGFLTRQMQRRFRYETQMLARLQHPHIAQIYDAGVHHFASVRDRADALPFFAMEYVEDARPITEFAQQQGLGTKERLRLFGDVCSAIQHGHQHGIIHRDIKPANVLVDGEGMVKVIDFGVARVTDSDVAVTTMQTGIGEIVGTVQYMSPEQCNGDSSEIDTRSDVYSLGLLFYELLTGVRPYDVGGLSVARAMKMVEEEEPARLSTIDRRLRGDLEVITLKALAKEANRRYQSVAELCEDVRRHLAGECISAKKPSWWVCLTRWMGRHPVWTSAVGALSVAAVILAAAGGTVWYGMMQPWGFRRVENTGAAFLVTMLGHPLVELGDDSERSNNVTAQMVYRTRGWKRDPLAVFCVHRGALCTQSQVWVSEPTSLEQPKWCTQPTPERPMPITPASWNVEISLKYPLRVYNWIVAEVFPDSAGPELIVTQEEDGESPNLITVFDLNDGRVLFDMWHCGHVSNVFWWEAEQLLVCAGERHGVPDISRYGYYQGRWPRIVFAVRPELGVRLGWINDLDWNSSDQNRAEVAKYVAWYNCVEPRETGYEYSHNGIILPPLTDDSARVLQLNFTRSEDDAGFSLLITADGSVKGFRANDVYERQVLLPNDRTPTLVDWPPSPPLPSAEERDQ